MGVFGLTVAVKCWQMVAPRFFWIKTMVGMDWYKQRTGGIYIGGLTGRVRTGVGVDMVGQAGGVATG